jgi:Resolvase, N terminal domain
MPTSSVQATFEIDSQCPRGAVRNLNPLFYSSGMGSADAAPRGYRIGYARDQNPGSQRGAIEAAGCDEIYIDKASGKLASRPEFDKALGRLRPDDTFVITRLSRAMRSLKHLIGLSRRPHRARRPPPGAQAGHRHHHHCAGPPGVPCARRDRRVPARADRGGHARGTGLGPCPRADRGASPRYELRSGEARTAARRPARCGRAPRVHHHPGGGDARRRPAHALPGTRAQAAGLSHTETEEARCALHAHGGECCQVRPATA